MTDKYISEATWKDLYDILSPNDAAEAMALDEIKRRLFPDWRNHTCGECGYFCYQNNDKTCEYNSCRKHSCDFWMIGNEPACPDYEPREVPE